MRWLTQPGRPPADAVRPECGRVLLRALAFGCCVALFCVVAGSPGIGGSEEAAIFISREFAKLGYFVEVNHRVQHRAALTHRLM